MRLSKDTQVSTPMISDPFSLFDEQFSITDFQKAIADKEDSTDKTIVAIRSAVKNAVKKVPEEDRSLYVVDIESFKEVIDSGDMRLDTNSAGEMFAQLRGKNGRLGKKLPIKEELIEQGVSVEAAELALQMELVQEQLRNIYNALSSIEGQITKVIQGQQNDRIGLYYSGLSLYLEARSISDESLRKLVIAQVLKSLNDANAQMIQELRSSIEYLATEQYRHVKKKTEKIDEQLAIIHQCYDIVYRAAFLKAAIYYENGEIPAMLTSIDEYGRFVEKLIVPFAGMLSELDRHNQFIEKGTWGSICNTLIECKELKKQIVQQHIYYLTSKEVSNGD